MFTALCVLVRPALSAPVVQQITGALDHKGTITISGSGFGAKPNAAPLVWDDASGNAFLDKWDGAWPDALPGYNTGYYAPMRGIQPPHSHDSRYIAGAHAGSAAANAGYDVIFFKNITTSTYPYYIYASWYQRIDQNWVFGGDNNYKVFAYSLCCSPYENPNDWMVTYGPPHPNSLTDTGIQWMLGANDGTILSPDNNGHIAWWDHAGPLNNWRKVEIEAKLSFARDGWVKVWDNGQQVIDYAGPTDNSTWASKFAGQSAGLGRNRTVGIGGFARMQHPENWRYFADAYLDTTLARVVLANNAVLSNATVIENQIPSQWSDTSITATVNLGQFTQGQTAYLFVVDTSGTASARGLTVTAGGANNAPRPPNAVTVK
jgi:hypothetical protein